MENRKLTQEEFIEAIAKDKLENLTFLIDLSETGNKKYKMLSKKTNKVISYDLLSLSIKIQNLYKSMTGQNISLREDSLKYSLMSIDEFKQDVTSDFGFREIDDIRYYNYYLESEFKQQINRFTEDFEGNKIKRKYEDNFDFSRYPCYTFLLNQLINPKNDKNKAYDENGKEIDLIKSFLTWLSFAITSKENASVYWCIISELQGVGKGVFTKLVQKIMGDLSIRIDNKMINSDFNGFLNNKTFVIYDEVDGNKEIYNTLKNLVGNETYSRKEKFKETTERKNPIKFLMTTNNKTPMQLDKSDRRGVFVYADNRMLKVAVKEDLNMTLEEFFDRLKEEELLFASDLCTLDYNLNEAAHTPIFNDTKREIIHRTNKRSDDLVGIINSLNFDELEDMLYDYRDTEQYLNLIKQLNAGFLNNEAITFLNESIDDEDFKKELRALGKKEFWNKKIGLTNRMVYTKEDGGKTSVIIRKLSNFNKSAMVDVLEGNDVKIVINKTEEEQNLFDDFDDFE